MIKDFYICLDNTALNYALKHFSNPFTRIMRCYTGLEVEMIVKTMESNKSKNFYTLRAMQNKILKGTIKNLEVLGTIFERADSSDECSYDKYSTSNQNIRNISYKMMKEMADEINSYVKEKELENTQKYEDNSKK